MLSDFIEPVNPRITTMTEPIHPELAALRSEICEAVHAGVAEFAEPRPDAHARALGLPATASVPVLVVEQVVKAGIDLLIQQMGKPIAAFVADHGDLARSIVSDGAIDYFAHLIESLKEATPPS